MATTNVDDPMAKIDESAENKKADVSQIIKP